MKIGMVGFLGDERVIVWDTSGGFSEVDSEIKRLIPKFSVHGSPRELDKWDYFFEEDGKKHTLSIGDEWLCYFFSSGHLKRVPYQDIFLGFNRAF